MIQIEHFTLNSFQTACHIVWDETCRCAIVDPGCHSETETDILTSFMESKGLKPQCIMLTHCHFDHIYGMSSLVRTYDIPVYASAKEDFTIQTTNPYICRAFGLPLPDTFPLTGDSDKYRSVSEGDIIEVGNMRFEVIDTPGHSAGGLCFLERSEKVLFSGDTLFAGAIGRTDHPGGNYDVLMKSIFEKLLMLDGETRVLPGHGPATDIATERMTNPFLMPFNEPYED